MTERMGWNIPAKNSADIRDLESSKDSKSFHRGGGAICFHLGNESAFLACKIDQISTGCEVLSLDGMQLAGSIWFT